MRRHTVIATLMAGALAVGAVDALALDLTPVPSANPKAPGVPKPNVLSPELAEVVRAEGSLLLENPVSADPTAPLYYGYNGSAGDVVPNLLPLPGQTKEASKTEPDKNTYLVLEGQ